MVQVFGHKHMPPHQLSAATGGISAAIVSALLRASDNSYPPLNCQDLLGLPTDTFLHWPSVVLGIILGLILAQLLEFLILSRHYFSLALRQRAWAWHNWLMSESQILSAIEDLRGLVQALSLRVSSLETQVLARNTSSGSPLVANYTVTTGNLPEVPPLPFSTPLRSSLGATLPTASSSASGTAAAGRRASDYSDKEHRPIAEEVGLFLRRGLEGDHRGESGRSRLALASRYYILVRDIRGEL